MDEMEVMENHNSKLGKAKLLDDFDSILDEDIDNDIIDEVNANQDYLSPSKIEDNEAASYLASKNYSQLDLYRMFSSELNTDSYVIRSDEQQDQWARIKTESTHKLGRLLLKIRYVAEELLMVCRDPKKNRRLFCILKTIKMDGVNSKRTEFSANLPDKAAEVLEAYLRGDDDMPFDKMADIIIITYNLSYLKFISKMSAECLAEFSQIKAIEDDYQSRRDTKKKTISLFDDQHSRETAAYIEKCNLNWRILRNVMTTMKALNALALRQRNKLVETNIRMCIHMAGLIYQRTGGDRNENYSRLDLIDEGLIGLMKGVDMYVYGVDAKVTTYAKFWIEQKVTRYVKNNNVVRIPVYVSDEVNKIIASLRVLERKIQNEGQPFIINQNSTRKAIEDALGGKPLKDENWNLAITKYSGVPIGLSCVTRESDLEQGEMNFDIVTLESDEEEDEPIEDGLGPSEGSRIIAIAKGMVREGNEFDSRKHITKLQFDLIYLQFVNDKTNREIAKIHGFDDMNDVRKEISKGLGRIRKHLEKINFKELSETKEVTHV
jgi:DNA-directed RNA polymerase specialized sigma subunit